ncbi:MAG: GTP-binding protein, partial [bacterium]
MSDVPVANIRNFVILGHSGTGKTTLTDALAFKMGLNDRLGLVSNGSSVSDTSEEEKNRKISIFASPFMGEYSLNGENYRLVFTDAPGFMDFYGQVLGAIHASDFALITVDAVSGVQVGTRRAWKACKDSNLPAVGFVITGLDKDNANFDKTLTSIRETFGMNCAPVTALLNPTTIINLLDAKELPDNLEEIHQTLAEAAAETDEALMEKYFAEGTLNSEEIRKGLHIGIDAGTVHPVYSVMSLKDIGVTELISSICRLLPAPGERDFKDVDGNVIKADAN